MSDRITVQVSHHGTKPGDQIKTVAMSGKLPAARWEQFTADLEQMLKSKYPDLTITSRS